MSQSCDTFIYYRKKLLNINISFSSGSNQFQKIKIKRHYFSDYLHVYLFGVVDIFKYGNL